MAVAAATAVIAPAAFLAAPAAYATTGGTSSTTSGSTGESETPNADETPVTPDTPAEETPADETPAEETKPGEETSAEETKPGEETKPAEETKPGDGTKPAEDTKPGEETKPGDDEDPEEGVYEECPVDEEGNDLDGHLELAVKGLPGKIVAGSGWHEFSLRATNNSDKALGTVQWALFVDNDFSFESEDEKDWLSTYTQLQYKDENGKWDQLPEEFGNGAYFGETELGAKAFVDLKLRLNISSKAPAGDAYSIGFGGYVDSEKNCMHGTFSDWFFTVLSPGSDNEEPGEAKPGDGKDQDPKPNPKPQGGLKEIPVTGSLAETGSSSVLPAIGIAGGVALVAGAGVVFAMKRRKGDAVA
ncbi:LPXTG cell wall anchor domain-containing protein [Streptomyces sp. NPDC059015]|uniref:LPXTG cell wall anchor domain-containing protein n=1 Tax=unclassified Streptomyces TaxID=2593676 RepID=UPI00369679E2